MITPTRDQRGQPGKHRAFVRAAWLPEAPTEAANRSLRLGMLVLACGAFCLGENALDSVALNSLVNAADAPSPAARLADAIAEVAASDDPVAAEIAQIVHDLSSADYAVRQRAEERLRRGGPVVLETLEALAASDDPELRLRATRIAQQVELLQEAAQVQPFLSGSPGPAPAGWDTFQKATGDSRAARELFVQVARIEGSLISSMHQPGDLTQRLFNERITEWHTRITSRSATRPRADLFPSTCALFLAASQPTTKIEPAQADTLCLLALRPEVARGLGLPVPGEDGDEEDEDELPADADAPESPPAAPGVAEATARPVPDRVAADTFVRLDTAMPNLFSRLSRGWFLRQDGGQDAQKLLLAANLHCADGLPVARRILAGEPSAQSQQALLFLSRAGTRDDLPLLESLFESRLPAISPSRKSGAPPVMEADVALAAAWLVLGEHPEAHRVTALVPDPLRGVRVGPVGFTSPADRERALEEYRQWLTDHPRPAPAASLVIRKP